MPLLARAHIRAGLVHLAAGLLLAVLTALQPVLDLPLWVAAFRPVSLHLLIVGWITQLIFGVAFWMFPRASKDRPYGSVRLGWLVFGLLNAGLVLRAIGEPLTAVLPGAGPVLVVSAVAQAAAGWLFIANTWPRVKER